MSKRQRREAERWRKREAETQERILNDSRAWSIPKCVAPGCQNTQSNGFNLCYEHQREAIEAGYARVARPRVVPVQRPPKPAAVAKTLKRKIVSLPD